VGGATMIGPETLVTRNDEPVAVEVDRTVVMMSVDQGMYFGLEGVGPRIWSLLEQPRSFRQLCDALTAEFEVVPDACRREVGAFLEELRRVHLVRFHDPAANPVHPAPGS
jgi:coenzyme PQQ synthesis protein D (PqqD)